MLILAIAIIAGIWDASIASWLPLWLQSFQAVLTIIVFTGLFFRFEQSIIVALIGGGILEIFDPASGGMIPLRYLLIALFIHQLALRIFTNRSIVGVITLSVSAMAIDRMLLFVFEAIANLTGAQPTLEAHASFFAESLCLAGVNVMLFLCIAAFSRRFMPSLMHFAGKTRL